MKKIFAQYPSVYYQILILFLLEEICFSSFSFSLYQFIDSTENVNSFAYISLMSSISYIIGGYVIDKLEDTKKALNLGAAFLLLGFILAIFSLESSMGLMGAMTFLYFGHSLFFIYCVMHIGAFFPIANDWKDNAFMIFLATSQILSVLLSFILIFFSDFLPLIFASSESIYFIGIIFWGLLFYLITKFKEVGFSISEEEEEQTNEEKSNLRNTMIGLILIAIIFSFISALLPNLGDANSSSYLGLEGLIQSFGGDEFILIDYILKILLIVGIVVAMYFAKYRSTHFSKINWILQVLLLMAFMEWGLNIFGNYFMDYLLLSSYDYIYSFLILPIFLSIITHINLDKNLGFWLGVLFAVPSIVSEFQSQFLLLDNAYYYSPYVAVLLLIVFTIAFRENQEIIKEKLALLNEPNRDDDEGEQNIDILEHFIDK